MNFEAHQFYHVYNRGNNRQKIYFTGQNYLYFIQKIRKEIARRCELLAYCLMPNHFHLLLFTTDYSVQAASVRAQPLIRGISTALSSYSQAMNNEHDMTGSLFQSKTKAKCLPGSASAHTCLHYIHQNPVRAALVGNLAEWPYSSYRDYAGLRSGTLCNRTQAAELLDLPPDEMGFVHESERILDPDRVRATLYC